MGVGVEMKRGLRSEEGWRKWGEEEFEKAEETVFFIYYWVKRSMCMVLKTYFNKDFFNGGGGRWIGMVGNYKIDVYGGIRSGLELCGTNQFLKSRGGDEKRFFYRKIKSTKKNLIISKGRECE